MHVRVQRERACEDPPRHSKVFALAPSLSLSSVSRERPLRIRKRRGPRRWRTRTCPGLERRLPGREESRGERGMKFEFLSPFFFCFFLVRLFVCCLVDSRDFVSCSRCIQAETSIPILCVFAIEQLYLF